MSKLKLATKWEVKEENGNRSIQLYDSDGNKLDGDAAYWEGDFVCSYNNLTSLEGAPKEVGGRFYCHTNNLTSLDGAPKKVGGNFNCFYNNLTSLDGAPKEVGGYFDCSYNNPTSLDGAPKEVGGSFYCHTGNLTSLEGAPKEVGGDFDCSYNNLTSLDGAPKEVGCSFYCSDNNLTSLDGAPKMRSNLFDSYLSRNFIFVDGILRKLISTKFCNGLVVYKVRQIGSRKISYVVGNGNKYAHGETVKEAVEDLRYKISDRDTSKYLNWNLTTTATIDEMIEAYRVITGACAMGTKEFVKSVESTLTPVLSVNDVINLTVNKYGHSAFKNFNWSK